MVNAILGRGKAQVIRLSLIYALLDQQCEIQRKHLESAMAMWEYSAKSVMYLYRNENLNTIRECILSELQEKSLSLTDIHNLFGKHQSKEDLEPVLRELLDEKRIIMESTDTGGRPKTTYTLNHIHQ